jgi:hypothetical protein
VSAMKRKQRVKLDSGVHLLVVVILPECT